MEPEQIGTELASFLEELSVFGDRHPELAALELPIEPLGEDRMGEDSVEVGNEILRGDLPTICFRKELQQAGKKVWLSGGEVTVEGKNGLCSIRPPEVIKVRNKRCYG